MISLWQVASVEMLSSLLRDRQRASVGGLELGPLLGRGSFGKVYKGMPGLGNTSLVIGFKFQRLGFRIRVL